MQNNLELAQKQSPSQTQIQSLEIMNLCNQDLYTFLNEEYMENPLMDKTGESAPGEVQEFDEWYLHGQTFNEGYGSEDKEAKIADVTKEEAKKCLEDLRGLEPCRIFAENLAECLITQFEVDGIEDEVPCNRRRDSGSAETVFLRAYGSFDRREW